MTQIDVTKHVLVPQHIKLSAKEKEEVLKKHGIQFASLPKLKREDPAIAHLEVKDGDVIKIIRKSQTAGEAVFYRGVLNE